MDIKLILNINILKFHYIFIKNKEGDFSLNQINNTSIQDKPATNILVTPYNLDEIESFFQIGDNFNF